MTSNQCEAWSRL